MSTRHPLIKLLAVLLLAPLATLRAADGLHEGLAIQTTAEETTCTSPWLKVTFSKSEPKMKFLSVMGWGKEAIPAIC